MKGTRNSSLQVDIASLDSIHEFVMNLSIHIHVMDGNLGLDVIPVDKMDEKGNCNDKIVAENCTFYCKNINSRIQGHTTNFSCSKNVTMKKGS